MGKGDKKPKKASGSSGEKKGEKQPPSKSPETIARTYTLMGTAVAVVVQLVLGYMGVNGYFTKPSAAKMPDVPQPPPELTPCPEGWPDCPRAAGLDWDAILELQSSPAAVPSPAAIEACDPTSLLSPQRVPGMHLLCVLPAPEGESGRVAATLVAYSHMERGQQARVVLVPSQLRTNEQLMTAIYRSLGMRRKGGLYQPPALFTDVGARLKNGIKGGLRQRRLLLMEGGQWLWPPVEAGHVHELPNLIPGQTTRVVTVSLKPLVVSVENFLSPGENEHIIARARPHMEKSGVALKDADKGKAAKEFRTSSQVSGAGGAGGECWAVRNMRFASVPRAPCSVRAAAYSVLRWQGPPAAGRSVSSYGVQLWRHSSSPHAILPLTRSRPQYFLPTVNDPQLEAIDRRVMMLTRIPISHAEYIQVCAARSRTARR